jgi:hypothetical protein
MDAEDAQKEPGQGRRSMSHLRPDSTRHVGKGGHEIAVCEEVIMEQDYGLLAKIFCIKLGVHIRVRAWTSWEHAGMVHTSCQLCGEHIEFPLESVFARVFSLFRFAYDIFPLWLQRRIM